MTTAIDVASYIESAFARHGMDNTRLQKLVYFSQAWSIGWTGRGIFNEQFEAWPNGPVERELWKVQRYGIVPKYRGQLTPETLELVDAIVGHYLGKTVNELVDLSHETVWQEARYGLRPDERSTTRLSIHSLRSHYISLAIQGKGPARPAPRVDSSAEGAAVAAAAVVEQWSDALALLATR